MIKRLLLITFTLAACGGGDFVSETCERLDECNALGTSVNDCTEELDLLLRQSTPSDRADLELLMEDCLKFQGCQTFLSCIGLEGSNSTNTGDDGPESGDDGSNGDPGNSDDPSPSGPPGS